MDLLTAMQVAEAGRARGCDSVCITGQGEPAFWTHLIPFILGCKSIGMAVRIITSGTSPLEKYEAFYDAGLNHILLSLNGIGKTQDMVSGIPGTWLKQEKLLLWLNRNNLDWRSNTTIQMLNYKELPTIAELSIQYGAYHVCIIGFLPHYEWDAVKLREVAVNPITARPYAEEAIYRCNLKNVWVQLKYHPMCHISPEYRKYVSNANNVLLDNGEWDYGHAGDSDEALKQACVKFGAQFGISGSPCCDCSLFVHCGGWNKTMADGFSGAGLTAIRETCPSDFGYYWYQNPFNVYDGRTRK